MYAGVPIDVPTWVSVRPGLVSERSFASDIAFATPKSTTSAWRPEIMMLSGFTSRWTMPCAWA